MALAELLADSDALLDGGDTAAETLPREDSDGEAWAVVVVLGGGVEAAEALPDGETDAVIVALASAEPLPDGETDAVVVALASAEPLPDEEPDAVDEFVAAPTHRLKKRRRASDATRILSKRDAF